MELMRRADGGVLRGAHLECRGHHEAEIEGEVEELHVARLEPPRVQPHLLRARVRVRVGQACIRSIYMPLYVYISPRRVGAHLDEEREVTLDDVVELSIVSE